MKVMKEKQPEGDQAAETERPPHRIRMPGFLIEGEIGLGDAIKRVTFAVGIRPCDGCHRRAAALNRWMAFTR
jgi:hypothetical protein